MKKTLLALMFILCSALELYAIAPVSSISQTKYRWRNDNGSEVAATWKAAENTAILLIDTSTVLRLRLELQNTSGATHTINEILHYSSNAGASWISIDNTGNAFIYQSSTNVANGAATTNQMGTGTSGTFQAGKIVSAMPAAASATIISGNKTEFEWVIKPTGNLLPMTTYIFRSAAQGSTPVNYATLNSGCVNVRVATKTDSSRCGPGTVSLKATGSAGTTVKWYEDPTGGVALGTGQDFTTPSISVTKVFYAAATIGATCESPRVPVTATVIPLPAVNLGNDVTVCPGNPATFNAGTFSSYVWDNGSTNQSRTVNAAGTYYVTVTGTGNCKGSDTVKLLNYPKPVVNLGNDTMICPGASLTLNAGNAGMQYLWDNGSTSQTRVVNGAGNYSVTVINEFGCPDSDMINIIVKDLPLGNINAVYGNPATYTFNVLNPLYAVGYVWNFGDGTPEVNAFMTHHTYAANGIYTVKLLLLGDCDSNAVKYRTVDVFDAGATSIDNLEDDHSVTLYPNPANESISIESKGTLLFKNIEVFNILGQKMIVEKCRSATDINLNTGKLASGIYSLRIETDKGFIVRKFEIRK